LLKALSTLATTVAEFGDYSRRFRRQSPFSVIVAANGDNLSPNSATVAVFSDSRRVRR